MTVGHQELAVDEPIVEPTHHRRLIELPVVPIEDELVAKTFFQIGEIEVGGPDPVFSLGQWKAPTSQPLNDPATCTVWGAVSVGSYRKLAVQVRGESTAAGRASGP